MDLAEKIDGLTSKVEMLADRCSPMSMTAIRCQVVMGLLHSSPDMASALRKAKTVCDFIETGRLAFEPKVCEEDTP